MEQSNIPLSWESTGDKWWYASPIDCAAANGHYELVKELLHLDENHLINLTSLRRIRRLEAVWDDDEQFHGVARSRSKVAYQLYNECEPDNDCGVNSLIVGGYGGWVLYTAASAGDLRFVEAVLQKYPFIVFGDGEYSLTDVLYGAARSKSCEVFRAVYDYAVSSKFVSENGDGIEEVSMDFKFEIKNRGVHAAARGGNLVGLKELLDGGCDVFGFRDVHGSTILHAAAGKGQVEVVKHLISSYDMISSVDYNGNTPLHTAAYKGQSSVIEALIQASPSSTSVLNKVGDTFLHTAVAGFRTPGFRRLNHQIQLMKQLVSNKWFNLEDIIDSTNNDEKTALHVAIIGNVHSDLVEVLMTARYINVNISDNHGMTPLDYLKQQPKSASSEILIRKLISAGGVSSCNDLATRRAFASQGVLGSPGTSFRVSDAELFRSTGRDSKLRQGHAIAGRFHSFSSISRFNSTNRNNYSRDFKRSSTLNNAAKRLKTMFSFSFKKSKATERLKETPVPLRQIYSNSSSPISSPINFKKFASSVPHDILRDQLLAKVSPKSPSRLYSLPSLNPSDKRHEMATPSSAKQWSLTSRLISPALCFGSSRLGRDSTKQPMGSVA